MRRLSITLCTVCVLLAHQVEAACTGSTGTPSPEAVFAFATSTTNNGNFGGVAGADVFCQTVAAGSTNPTIVSRAANFKAILTDATISNVFLRFSGPSDVMNSNNLCLGSNMADAFSATETHPLLTEKKVVPTTFAFTGANPDGSRNALTCSGWTSTSGSGYVSSSLTGLNILGGSSTACGNSRRLLCAEGSLSSVTGDPQFMGLQGQQFQVHGIPDEYFALISHPSMQLNSKFTWIASGSCTYSDTPCWTHPGTYVSQLAWMFPGIRIKAIAHTHLRGLSLYINEHAVKPTNHSIHLHTHTRASNATLDSDSNGKTAEVIINHHEHNKLRVSSDLFTIQVTNSDMFFNFEISLHHSGLLVAGAKLHSSTDTQHASPYPAYPLHGLVGQTWKNIRHTDNKMYEGDVGDYMLADSNIFSTEFKYNHYSQD